MAIVAAGAYVPYRRLERSAIAAALGTPPAPGTRAVASYDEDTTTMGVEAARAALDGLRAAFEPRVLLFATADPAYLDKTNASAIHAALGLDPAVAAYDVGGSARSGIGALRLAAGSAVPTLVVLADVRTGLPGSADERDGGDGAAAFVVAGPDGAGPDGAVADAGITRVLGRGAATLEFLDRWRLPGERSSHLWEERFGEHAYVPVAQAAFADACKDAGIAPDAVDHLVVTGTHARAVRGVIGRSLGTRPDVLVDDLTAVIGNTGTAHPGIVLASLLDRADPGALVAVVHAADGADAIVFRVTEHIAAARPRRAVADQIAAGSADLSYETFLTWRGFLDREPPRRPDPTAPGAPLVAQRPVEVRVHRRPLRRVRRAPPPAGARLARGAGAVDQMRAERMADVQATVATFTVDRLAFTPSPPLVAAVLDFDGGGRFRCELTDVDPATVAIGDRVEMTFRRVSTAQHVHNYFWKARPLR